MRDIRLHFCTACLHIRGVVSCMQQVLKLLCKLLRVAAGREGGGIRERTGQDIDFLSRLSFIYCLGEEKTRLSQNRGIVWLCFATCRFSSDVLQLTFFLQSLQIQTLLFSPSSSKQCRTSDCTSSVQSTCVKPYVLFLKNRARPTFYIWLYNTWEGEITKQGHSVFGPGVLYSGISTLSSYIQNIIHSGSVI